MFLFHFFIEKTAVPTEIQCAFTLSPICIRSFSLPKGIIGMITQYIQINAFKDIFHNYLS